VTAPIDLPHIAILSIFLSGLISSMTCFNCSF
jgi:hypothetical protein